MNKVIELTRGYTTKVCECHYDLVKDFNWYFCPCPRGSGGYAVCRITAIQGKPRQHIKMHRLINSTPDGLLTDHLDRDKLNNICSNLRTATRSINNRNRDPGKTNISGFTGVNWRAKEGKWVARIKFDNVETHLGLFTSLAEALLVRGAAEL